MDSTGGGSGPFLEVKGFTTNDTQTSVIISQQTPGQIYYFRYRALNAMGWGGYSPVSFVRMANIPATLASAITSNVGDKLQIAWSPTPDDNASAVFQYRIKIKRIDGTFVENSDCDGSDPIIFANGLCLVRMSTLILADFFLIEGQLIEVTIEAMNDEGYSIPSPINT